MTTTTDKPLITEEVVSFYVGEHHAAEPLTLSDLCDHAWCSARARFRYRDPVTGLELDFCRHHDALHGPQLDELGWRIVAVAQ